MVMMRDGGGGGDARTVTSDVTVDPGQIMAFAKFLDEMLSELKTVETAVGEAKQVPATAFGVYRASEGAATRHRKVLDAEVANLKTLVTRMGEIANATTTVAKSYTDLEELNSANGVTINAQLAAGAHQ